MPTPTQHWLPWDLVHHTGAPQVRWARVDSHIFGEPFFEDGLRVASRAWPRDERTRLAPLESLAEWAEREPEVPVAGLVFHTSRCGSTLVMQLLQATGQVAVVAEPPVVEQVLRLGLADAPWRASGDEVAVWVRGAMHALAQRRGQAAVRATVVKLDAWLMGSVAAIGAAVPGAWRVFLHREPAAVLASHRAMRGMFMVPGLVPHTLLGTAGPCADPARLDAWAAEVLLAIGEQGLAAVERGAAWPLAYERVVEQVPRVLLPALGVAPTPEVLRGVSARAQNHAKRPGEVFSAPPVPALSEFDVDATVRERLTAVYAALYARSAASNSDSSQALTSTSMTR